MKARSHRTGLQIVALAARVEAALWRRLRFEGELHCRSRLFDRYRPFARAIAGRQARAQGWSRVDAGDFEQFAYEGLLQAIDRFDPLRGVAFPAFAKRRVVGAIINGSSRLSEIAQRLSFRRRVEQERLATLREATDTSEGTALQRLGELAAGLAVGLMLEADGNEPADPAPNAYEGLAWRETRALLVQVVAALPEREALIIREHYLNGVSLTQVAALLGLSKGRVSQLHHAALARLRRAVGRLT